VSHDILSHRYKLLVDFISVISEIVLDLWYVPLGTFFICRYEDEQTFCCI
jgi:hypothetical protein